MPYTPPSQISPAASTTTTPSPSRSSSYLKGFNDSDIVFSASERPQLPRSAGSSSYLNRQRRSPTVQSKDDRFGPMTDSQRGITLDPHGSMRKSPPPVTNGLIPSGMTISPPDSSQNSDDEEVRGRSRELENLEELQAAISQIHVRRSSSPTREGEKKPKLEVTTSSISPASHSSDGRPPLSKEARKISHSRSCTDSNIVFEPNRLQPPSPFPEDERDSEDSDDSDGPTIRPPMVRKKSGELVRPALRPASRRRPSSMPGTPTYSKAVHFDSHLEHVRHFLQVDKPLAVSAGSSPVETYESESEFPFGSDESSARSRGTSYEWEMRLANFPPVAEDRPHLPVHVERVFLSSDNKNLIGSVAVQNLAFQKSVVARFTLDYWKTTSEVVADFSNDIRRGSTSDGLDRFDFSIRLADQANLENKTLFFCVKYIVNGQDYWDNNNNYNYQVDFAKKVRSSPKSSPRPQPSGLGARPLNALPRSRPSPPASAGRSPVSSMTVAFDDFATNFDNFGSPFGQSPSMTIGEPKIKLRSPKSKSELLETPMRRNKSTPMFGTRYDFNSSLTAAKNSAYAVLGDQSGLSSRSDAKQFSRPVPAVAASKGVSDAPQKQENGVRTTSAEQPAKASVASASMASNPASALLEKPALTSQSYQELVEKYCFFGTAKTPPLTKNALSSLNDGASDDKSATGSSSGSSTATANAASPPSTIFSSLESFSAQNTRTSSPLPRTGSCASSRSASPARFNGYFYPHFGTQILMSETPTATAIQG